jgi:hypothetical protein
VSGLNLDIVEAIDADGGHAAIRVTGLSALPPDPTFRIDPIDDALGDSQTDWPSGPRRPAAVKAIAGGFDLVLGPDVLESPLLAPGTPVIVSITDTDAEAELIWPSIATRRPRVRRPVIVTEALREAERTQTETKRREADAILATATARVANAEPSRAPRPHRKTAALKGGTAGAGDPGTGPDGRVLSGFKAQLQSEHTAAALIRKDGGRAHPLPGTALAPVAPSDLPRPARRGRQIAAFGGGLGLAALLMFGLVQFRVVKLQPGGQVAGGTPDVALTLAKNSGTLRTVLATGGMSPRGRAASGVDGVTALRFADGHLYGTSDIPRDQGEASFWLRHALTQPIDHESMKWAYTQLGSIYAQPDGFAPDYAKARLLWEISSALGDPVAMCFNASLYEHGLGVPKHRDLARALYERARNAGGCRGVDDALKRTN